MTAAEVFRVDIEAMSVTHVVRPCGDLDGASASRLLESVGQVTAAEGLVLDLSGLTFLDAAGLGAIVTIRDQVQATG